VSWPRAALIVVVTLVLQVTLFSRFSFEGARPDLMILLAVMAGFRFGPERGAIIGFAAGVSFDIVLSTPLGLSALVYTIVGYAVGVTTAGMVRTSRWAASAVAAAGSAAGMVLYALVGAVLGEPTSAYSTIPAAGSAAGMVLYALVGAVLGEPTLDGPSLGSIVVLVAAVNAVLAPLASRALAWAGTDERDRRQPFLAR